MDVISTLQLRHNRRGRRLAAPLVCLALGTLVLSGCGSARQTFGLDRKPPDEFSVLTRAPLAVPPEYKLRPPTPGAPRPQELDTRQQAASAVFGSAPQTRQQAAASSSATTTGESALLNQAGATAGPAGHPHHRQPGRGHGGGPEHRLHRQPAVLAEAGAARHRRQREAGAAAPAGERGAGQAGDRRRYARDRAPPESSARRLVQLSTCSFKHGCPVHWAPPACRGISVAAGRTFRFPP